MSDGEQFCIGGRCFPVTTLFGEPAAFTGEPHFGIDVATPLGTPVEAGVFGSVRRVFSEPIGGLQVELAEQGGASRLLAHLRSVAVRAGEPVAPATIIGTSGESGVVTGPHLHFERRGIGGAPIDPLAPDCPPIGDTARRQIEILRLGGWTEEAIARNLGVPVECVAPITRRFVSPSGEPTPGGPADITQLPAQLFSAAAPLVVAIALIALIAGLGLLGVRQLLS